MGGTQPATPSEPEARASKRRGREPNIEERRERAAVLKERIYLTFTALAVVLALQAHPPEYALEAFLTLLVTVLGVLLAVFLADMIADVVVHERIPTRDEVRHALRVSFGAIGALALPFLFLGLASFGVWPLLGALRASAIALVVALVVIGLLAIRRVPLTPGQRLIALGAEAVLGLATIGLQLLAHSG